MFQILAFTLMYGGMMFIWTYVYLNRSDNKINQAFLTFLSTILVWMTLSVGNEYNDSSLFGLVIKTVYWYSMMTMSVFFLLFIYRLVKRELDAVFFCCLTLNTLTIFARYFFPIDYSDPTFWRLSHPVVAPIMSFIFSLPALYALFLVIRRFVSTKDIKQRNQLIYLFVGIGLALSISVLSEYILPTIYNINTHLILMYFAILIFVIFIFISIMKHRMLNIQGDYIFKRLFMNSGDGIIIVNKRNRIVSVNSVARCIFKNRHMDTGDKITDYIESYDFEENYKQHEIAVRDNGSDYYLSLTQYPIEPGEHESAKLMTITDITTYKRQLQQEKEILLEKSSVDQLTGLYNKHYLYDNYYTDKQEESGDKIVLTFIDVDGFKYINDMFGHLTGDRVLRAVAECIKENLSADAKAFRFGGDEFVIIYRCCLMEDAYRVAERIRRSVNNLDFSRYDMDIKISLSVGLVEGVPPVKGLITKADMAMYESKTKGKNMTTIFTDINAT